MGEPRDDSTSAEVEEYARGLVHGGFLDRDEVLVAVGDHAADVLTSAQVEAQVEALVDRLWEARLAEQAGWPETTDADRLFEVFDGLDARGIVARADFTCCRTCGLYEIGAEAGEGARGFVFFHRQDTERLVAGGGLWLAYGSLPGSPDDTAAVGREVADALRAGGLPVEWNGSPDARIAVAPLDWRCRLPVD